MRVPLDLATDGGCHGRKCDGICGGPFRPRAAYAGSRCQVERCAAGAPACGRSRGGPLPGIRYLRRVPQTTRRESPEWPWNSGGCREGRGRGRGLGESRQEAPRRRHAADRPAAARTRRRKQRVRGGARDGARALIARLPRDPNAGRTETFHRLNRAEITLERDSRLAGPRRSTSLSLLLPVVRAGVRIRQHRRRAEIIGDRCSSAIWAPRGRLVRLAVGIRPATLPAAEIESLCRWIPVSTIGNKACRLARRGGHGVFRH